MNKERIRFLSIATFCLLVMISLLGFQLTSVLLARSGPRVATTAENPLGILLVARAEDTKLRVQKLLTATPQGEDISFQVTTVAELETSAPLCDPLQAQLAPDREWLAVTFICPESLAQTQLVHLSTGTVQVIEGDSNYVVLKWFPDSHTILFHDIQRDLLTMAGPGVRSRFADIPHQRYSVAAAALELGGYGVIYSTYDGLWRFDFRTAKRTKLADFAPYGIPIVDMSPTGEWLAYVAVTQNSGVGALYLLKRPFDNPQQVGELALFRSARWSPRGRQLALVVGDYSSGDKI